MLDLQEIASISPQEMKLSMSFNEFLSSHPYPDSGDLDICKALRTLELKDNYTKDPELLSRTQLVELSWDNIDKAVQFVREQFSYDAGEDPGMFLAASLTPDDTDSLAFLHSISLTNSLRYSLTIDGAGEVIGISGLYQYQIDDEDVVWLGWTAVEEAARRHGVFQHTFEHLIQTARAQGKSWIKLYTSTDPHEEAAQHTYDKLGMNTLSPGQTGYPSREMEQIIMEPYKDVTTSKIILRGMPLNQ